MGELEAASLVKPTMSLKKMVTESNVSGATAIPCFRSSATDLEKENKTLVMKSLKEHTNIFA